MHFTTYGIDFVMLGALKMTAQRVPVRGIVSNASPNVIEEVKTHRSEAAKLEVRTFPRTTIPEMVEVSPHQKLVVIDGLLAFKGAANLTTRGWRNAAQGRDHIEVVTDVKEVVDLNNRLFSPIWGATSKLGNVKRLDWKEGLSVVYSLRE